MTRIRRVCADPQLPTFFGFFRAHSQTVENFLRKWQSGWSGRGRLRRYAPKSGILKTRAMMSIRLNPVKTARLIHANHRTGVDG